MVFFNASTKELNIKIVYYGPGLSGKTTNLQHVYNSLPDQDKGRMLSLATSDDRTLFFDFLPLELGVIHGMKTRIQLYTVPGQVFYNTTRKLVLKGCDGVVFIADSQRGLKDANRESLDNLRQNLLDQGDNIEMLPLVIQYNKRDLDDIMDIEEMREYLNPKKLPDFGAIATEGEGVFETLKQITKMTLKNVSKEQGIQLSIQMKEEEPKPEKKEEPAPKKEQPKKIEKPVEQEKVATKPYAVSEKKPQPEKADIKMGWDKKTENISFAAEAFREEIAQPDKEPEIKAPPKKVAPKIVEKKPEQKPPIQEVKKEEPKLVTPKQAETLEKDKTILRTAEDLMAHKKNLEEIADEIKVKLSNTDVFIDHTGIRVPVIIQIPKDLSKVNLRFDMQIIHSDGKKKE